MPQAAPKKQNTTSEAKVVKSEVKVDVKPDVKVDVKTDVKPDVKPDVKTDVKPDVKVDVKTEVKTDVKPEVAKKPRGKAAAAAAVVVAKVDETGASIEETSADDKTGENASTDNVVQTLADKIGSLALLVKDIQSSLKPVLKEHDKLRKIVERIQKKRDNARKSPSGFAKPNKISDELCDFIGVPHGTEKSRTDITRHINAYVKEHNLNKPTNRRIILPDDKLKRILKINNDEEVTFFILQRLISHHFPTAGSKVAPVVSSV
jgi:chromatin remodeling complex protein RSC6